MREVLAWALVLALYFECGRRTLQVLLLDNLAADRPTPILDGMVDGSIPRWYTLAWYVLWGPVMLSSWVIVRLSRFSTSAATAP